MTKAEGRPIRVLFVNDHLGMPGGIAHGGTTYLTQTLTGLDRARVHPALAILRTFHPAEERLRSAGIEVRFFGRSKWDPRAFFDILRLAREWRIDLLHLNGKKAHLLGRLAGRWLGIPSIIHLHFEYKPRPRWLQRWLAPRTDLALGVSQRLHAHALRAFSIPPSRARVLYNGADVRRFEPRGAELRGAVRSAQGVLVSEPLLLVPGRITENPDKGQRIAIQAFALLRARCPEVRMWIVGEGTAREGCEKLAQALGMEDRIRFFGQRSDLPELLAASDIVVIPSSCNDAFPFTAVEAMCAGRPVVASLDGGLEEMLADSSRGLLVPPKDPQAFADACLRLIQDPAFAGELARAGSAFARELTVERHVEALAEHYEALVRPSVEDRTWFVSAEEASPDIPSPPTHSRSPARRHPKG